MSEPDGVFASKLRLFDLLALMDSRLRPTDCKVHLASRPDDGHDPFEAYLSGRFEEWQCWQNALNFNRPHVVALIQITPGGSEWLFAGAFDSMGHEVRSVPRPHYWYSLRQRPETGGFVGRIVVRFHRDGRNSYRLGENVGPRLLVEQVHGQRRDIGEFPGFGGICLSKAQLDRLVSTRSSSWESALSSVAGVYVIVDTVTGKSYGS
ncbi:MAG: hypothetical protein R3B68_14335 [Phycisphaerales bacterium]